MLNDGESCAYTAEDNEMEAGLGHNRTFGGGGGGGCEGSGASAASAAAGRKRRNRKKRRCGGAPIADIQEVHSGWGMVGSYLDPVALTDSIFFCYCYTTDYSVHKFSIRASLLRATPTG
jgi:hypothetical protein